MLLEWRHWLHGLWSKLFLLWLETGLPNECEIMVTEEVRVYHNCLAKLSHIRF